MGGTSKAARGAGGPHRPTAGSTEDLLLNLVERARTGDQEAWNRLVGRLTPLLWWVARSYGLSATDAADVVQMTWLRCVEHLDRIREPERIAAWLATTCRRQTLLTLRQNARYLSHDAGDPTGPLANMHDDGRLADPADTVVASEQEAVLRNALRRLPEHQRRVLLALLGDDAEQPYGVVAARLGTPVGSIGPTRQRALSRLRGDPEVRAFAGAIQDR